MDTSCKILIAGVGGQGTLLASRVLGQYAGISGYDCKLSEVHGMAQRGGSVVTHFIMGKKVYSPIIEPRQADMLLAFEALEGGRYAHYVKDGGIIIANTQMIMPITVINGDFEYRRGILDELKQKGLNVREIDAAQVAQQAGSVKAVNIVMIGYAAHLAGLNYDIIKEAVNKCVPPKTLGINLKALELGFNLSD
jgi:indolepyruvate ferredoxin oxidoreductase beta subunit